MAAVSHPSEAANRAAISRARSGAMSAPARFGESPDYRLSRDRARAASDAFLRSQSLGPAAFLLGLLALLAWQLTGLLKQMRVMRYAAVLLALCATLPSEIRTPGEFLLHYTISLAMAAAGIAFCCFFARRNYLAYALVLWLMALRTPMMQLLGTGNPALQMQGWLIVGIMAVTLVWAVVPAWFGRGSTDRI